MGTRHSGGPARDHDARLDLRVLREARLAGQQCRARRVLHPARERLDALAPLGTYELRYAAGQTWYGTTHLFGPETSCSRADSQFEFRETPDGYSGYTVELFLQVNGNLRTRTLAREDF